MPRSHVSVLREVFPPVVLGKLQQANLNGPGRYSQHYYRRAELLDPTAKLRPYYAAYRRAWQWLFINSLTDVAALRKLVEFYVREHNTVMPHAAFDGQTRDEMYFGRGAGVPQRLTAARQQARQERVRRNRQTNCAACTNGTREIAA